MRSILLSSLAFSVLALAVLAFRRFRSENYSRRLARALWIVVVLRMVIPFTLSDGLAVISLPRNQVTERLFQAEVNLLAQSAPAANESEIVITEGEAQPSQNLPGFEAPMLPQAPPELIVAEPVAQSPVLAKEGEPSEPTLAPWQNWSAEKILTTIYGLGVGFSLGFLALSYLKFRSAMKRKLKSVHPETEEAILALIGRDVRLFAIEHDESPMTMGIFRPWLILPARLLPSQAEPRSLSQQLQFVLKHEYAHIRKRDLWLKTLYLLGRAIQWFNPLAYLIQDPLNEDIELATDEEVAHTMPRHERAAYCRSILEVAEALPTTANNYSSRFTGDVKSMKKRISTLFKEGKTKRGITVMLLLLLAASLTIGLVSCELEGDHVPAINQITMEDNCYDFEMTVGTKFEIVLDQDIVPNPNEALLSSYPEGVVEVVDQHVDEDWKTLTFTLEAVQEGDTIIAVDTPLEISHPGEVMTSAFKMNAWVRTEEMASEWNLEKGVVTKIDPTTNLDESYASLSPEDAIRAYYAFLENDELQSAYRMMYSPYRCVISPLRYLQNEAMRPESREVRLLSITSKEEWDLENPAYLTKEDVPGVCQRYIVEVEMTGVDPNQPYKKETQSFELPMIREGEGWKIGNYGPIGTTTCDPYRKGLVESENLLRPQGSCKDYFMTVGTEFEIEFDRYVYPSYGAFEPSEYDTSGPIRRVGRTDLPETNSYTDHYTAVEPGEFSVLRSKNACFFFWVLTEEEAKEQGVASGVVVPAQDLPPLEKDYSNASAKEILQEFYDLMNAGKFDQAYQLTLNGAYFTASPLQFIRNSEAVGVQTEILSLLTKEEYYQKVGLEKTNDLGDVPGICERLMVETRNTGIGTASDGAVRLSEVTLSKVDGMLTIVSIGLPTCCGCNEFHGEVQQSSLVRTSTMGALTLYQYNLKPIRVDSLSFTPLLPDQLPINAAFAGAELRILREKFTIGEAVYAARQFSTEEGESRVVVEKDGELVFTAPDIDSQGQELGIVGGVRGGIKVFTKVDESWLLEVTREKAEEGSAGEGMLKASGYLYLDGESINDKYGYDSAFNFQILAGKPFFFFEKEGKTGFSYDWEEFDLPFDNIIHYACCSAGVNNPREFENLVAFVVSDGAEMTYYELVNLAPQVGGPLELAAPIRVEKNGITIEVQKVEQDQDRITFTVKYQLKDWRGWGLSNVKLLIGDKYYQYPSFKLIEQRIQKLEDQVCLSNHVTGESCQEGSSDDLYRIEELTFSGVPTDLEGQKVRLEIWRYRVDPPEGARYCEVMRVDYIQDQLAKKYPDLVLNCIVGPGMNGVVFVEGTPFAEDPEARNDFNSWLKQALAEAIVGPWEFDIVE